MSASSRRKGVKREREVAAVYQAAGLDVRNLEGSGDHLIVCAGGLTIHSETKGHKERVRIPEWIRQTEAEAPQGTVPALHWRQDRGRWYVNLPLDDFAAILSRMRALLDIAEAAHECRRLADVPAADYARGEALVALMKALEQA